MFKLVIFETLSADFGIQVDFENFNARKMCRKPSRLFKIRKAVISVGYKLKLQIPGDHVDVTPGVGVYVTTAVLYY